MAMRSPSQMRILVVEDSAQDATLIRSAVEHAAVRAFLHMVEDGAEAVDYLRGSGKYHDRHKFPLPTFVLSDVKMPQMDGFQFLRWVRSYREYARIPIVLFSGAGIGSDIEQAYESGANAYLIKPTNLEQLTELLRVTCDFWSRCACPELQDSLA